MIHTTEIGNGGLVCSTEIVTNRTCDEHAPAKVSWDYTEQGDCPACRQTKEVALDENYFQEEIKDLNKQIDEANEHSKALEAKIDDLEEIIEKLRGQNGR